jgi:hypothetical protein
MNLKKKMIAVALVVFILFLGNIVTIGTALNKKNITFEEKKDIATSHYANSSLLITNISDGRSLTMTVWNKGSDDVQNIKIKVNSSGGIFTLLPKKEYDIPIIPHNSSTDIQLKIFGLGLGKFTTYPNITMSIIAAGYLSDQQKISVKLFGRWTKIMYIFQKQNASYNGYTLFSPEYSQITYLINNNNNVIHTWNSSSIQGLGLHLLETGDLLRTNYIPTVQPFLSGGVTGRVEILDWNNTLVWSYTYATEFQHCLHHDISMLPNGNILMIAWEYKTNTEAIAAGRIPSTMNQEQLWPDHIIEVKPTGPDSGDIVWEWHVWDHLIQDYDRNKPNYGNVAAHPELIDINFFGTDGYKADWNHINSIDYNKTYDQILLSVRNFCEIWVIDHSTTMEEAAGHSGGRYGKGGDLLYRWGNPQAYKTGTAADQKFYGQHDADWIPSGCPGKGRILVFNNGVGRPGGEYSSVDEIAPPIDASGNYLYNPGTMFGPMKQLWVYTTENPFNMFSRILSGAQRLPNGNTLICDGLAGVFYEVNAEKIIVWQYANEFPCVNQFYINSNDVANVKRYALDYPGIKR